MDINTIMTSLQLVACIILGGLTLYFKYNAKLKEKATAIISEAEDAYKDTVKAGGRKHEYVVSKLYEMIPIYLKPIITKDMVSTIVDLSLIHI